MPVNNLSRKRRAGRGRKGNRRISRRKSSRIQKGGAPESSSARTIKGLVEDIREKHKHARILQAVKQSKVPSPYTGEKGMMITVDEYIFATDEVQSWLNDDIDEIKSIPMRKFIDGKEVGKVNLTDDNMDDFNIISFM